MQERFSDRARYAMALANREAGRLNHDYIGPEHILLGIFAERTCVAVTVLAKMGVDIEALTVELGDKLSEGHGPVQFGRRPQSEQTRSIIIHAVHEARQLGHRYVGTEHLVLGMLEQEGLAGRVLASRGINSRDFREEVLAVLRSSTDASHDLSQLSFGDFEWAHQQELAKAFRSPAFWHTLILAVDSANRLGSGEVRPEHLLLALLRDRKSAVAEILDAKGVTIEWARSELAQRLGAATAEAS